MEKPYLNLSIVDRKITYTGLKKYLPQLLYSCALL